MAHRPTSTDRPRRQVRPLRAAWGRTLAGTLGMLLLVAACSGGTLVPGTPGHPSRATPEVPQLTPAVPAPQLNGPLRTDAAGIVDVDGQAVRLLGVNLQGMQSSNDQGSGQLDECGRGWELPPADAAANIARWGFNAVRLPLAWANLEPVAPTPDPSGTLVHQWGTDYLTALDGLIASLRAQGLAVILDMAQYQWSSAFKETGPSATQVNCEGYGMPAWMYPNADSITIQQAKCDLVSNQPEPGVLQNPWDGLTAVWSMLATRYAGDPSVVAADVMNEPYFQRGGCPHADFAGFYRTLGTTVRAVATDWLLIFEYFPPANALFGIDSPPPFDNEVYSIHVYTPDWASAQEFISAGSDQARQWGIPLLVGEFDAFGEARASGGRDFWQEQTLLMLAYMNERGISWTFFGYAGGLSMISRDGIPKVTLIETLQNGF